MSQRPRRPRRTGSDATISSVLDATLGHLNLGARLREFRLKKLWPDCVGEAIAKRACPERLMGTVLFCSVESSPWMTELNYQKTIIIGRLNETLGPGAITEIVFRAGQVKGRKARKPEVPTRPLTPEEESFIEKTTGSIRDTRLKNLIERVMRMCKS
ncbi:MAG TPA: hypothetical protein DDW94_12735 [Deltaproteobacteria bacterium]|nr:MAG: hypothetical protein A2Z79_07040 [Deltaproteobacteria bacterium GWA2_55_82]OGQ63240.1 MAG: hypothetical protein A3I81_00560 [Deltaproteobacteria bacterium RIFCSPLOWO2_02_FULL_55_12]OIJ73075.1 MAG: hypothetical protein A2V21_301625 [Deltaproteobacteria bacterium GWC2_55_46]HBG47836.1 hypothetical protein [Deltaproteobacteria bacterium]HCY11901.1 hypothetical protein [Deltaproteobacteria bacterium]